MAIFKIKNFSLDNRTTKVVNVSYVENKIEKKLKKKMPNKEKSCALGWNFLQMSRNRLRISANNTNTHSTFAHELRKYPFHYLSFLAGILYFNGELLFFTDVGFSAVVRDVSIRRKNHSFRTATMLQLRINFGWRLSGMVDH